MNENNVPAPILLPCPFCGSVYAKIIGRCVECLSCGASAKDAPNYIGEAIAAWNRRALAATPPSAEVAIQLTPIAQSAIRGLVNSFRNRKPLNRSDVQNMRAKTYEQCADELEDLLTALLRDTTAPAAPPEGFVMVPVELTAEMVDAVRVNDNWPSLLSCETRAIYTAMLAAALATPQEERK